ncbi:hypothetical protein ACFXD5_06705 [Streptomyces sp. NPDC059385]|uniref:hypothetical protein n=1 Tax=Streptomyces sp. NPDC059385 TaxID=3346817 RepID=UPI0036756368
MSIGLSLAGALVCVGIFYTQLRRWWTGNREPKLLLHFAQGLLMGALATLCAGGILGLLSGCTRQGVSAGADKAVSGLTGTGPGTPMAAHSLAGQLTPEGGVVVALVTAMTVIAYKAAGKDDKKRLLGGLICGACLMVVAGVAGALDGLPGLVNEAGAAGRRVLEGGSL